jgi:hypothetical protein
MDNLNKIVKVLQLLALAVILILSALLLAQVS